MGQQGRFQMKEYGGNRGAGLNDSYQGRQNRSSYSGDNFSGDQGSHNFVDDNFDIGQRGIDFMSNNYNRGKRSGDYMDNAYSTGQGKSGNMNNGGQRRTGGNQRSSSNKHGKFDSAANQRLIRLAGNYNQADLDMAGGEDDFGGGKNIHLGLNNQSEVGGNIRNQYDDFGGGQNQGMGGSNYDYYDNSSGMDRASMLGIDRNQLVSYPNIYSSQGSSGMFGDNSNSPKKRRFTEGPVNDYGMIYFIAKNFMMQVELLIKSCACVMIFNKNFHVYNNFDLLM